MTRYVLDTSVIVKWFSGEGEPDLEAALRLRQEIVAGTCVVTVPDLLYYELGNALRYNPSFESDDVKKAVQTIFDMAFFVRGPDPEIIRRAVDLAFEANVTVYDATFLALAEAERALFVTADYDFCDRVKDLEGLARLDYLFPGVRTKEEL